MIDFNTLSSQKETWFLEKHFCPMLTLPTSTPSDVQHVNFCDFWFQFMAFFSPLPCFNDDGKVSYEKVLLSCRIDWKMQPDDEGDVLRRGYKLKILVESDRVNIFCYLFKIAGLNLKNI